MGPTGEMGTSFLVGAVCGRTRGNGFRVKESKFRLAIRKFCTVVRHCEGNLGRLATVDF